MSGNKLIRFLWTTILLVSLCVLAGFYAEYFMGCLLSGAALLVVFQIQSISDEQSRSLLVIQGILALLFSLFAGHFAAYLIFYEWRVADRNKKKRTDEVSWYSQGEGAWEKVLRIIFPGLFCFFGTVLQRLINGEVTESLPEILWHVLLLIVCSVVFYGIEFAISHYLRIQWESAVAVRSAAVNELYEKKLNQELRMKNYLAERNARMEERENISRNIHNSVGHTITAAVMTLDAAELLVDVNTGKAKERMVTAKERMKEGLSAVRLAVRVLDKENDTVRIEDFLSELSAVADNFVMDTELTVKTDVDMVPEVRSLPKVHTEFFTGAVQELLTNGVKHGNATRFLLSIRADSAHLQVSVRDNGTGDFSEENKNARIKAGFGLKKIMSYLKKCGGDAKFTNDNGFCAVLTVPLMQEETNGEE
ncbi:MAG: hypothetical protein IKB07_02730 [Lachnospiraceae bacterium]|nr:hypothetical protein [Lachnospiraceae bacterium]